MRVSKFLRDARKSFRIDVNAGRKLPASVGTLDEQHAHGAIRMFSGVGVSQRALAFSSSQQNCAAVKS
jgi:hypothetical protein